MGVFYRDEENLRLHQGKVQFDIEGRDRVEVEAWRRNKAEDGELFVGKKTALEGLGELEWGKERRREEISYECFIFGDSLWKWRQRKFWGKWNKIP